MAENKSFLARMFNPQAAVGGSIRYPFVSTIFGPYMVLLDSFRLFFYTAALCALVMSAIYLLGGQALFCSFNNFTGQEICSSNFWAYAGTRVIVLFVVAAFCVRYYRLVWQKQPFSWGYLLRPGKADIYSFIALLIFVLLNAVSGVSAYLLTVRVPNPDWRIELAYFGVVSIGFVVPFVLLRFYGILAYVWSGEKILPLWQMWRISRGNGLRLLLSMAIWFFLFIFALSAVSANFSLVAGNNPLYIIFIGEYIFSFVVLILMGFFVNYCGLQKMFLTEGKHDEEGKNH